MANNDDTVLITTVGASVVGALLAGPVGAVVAGSVAYSATAPASPLCRKGLMISRVTMPQEGLVRQQGVTYFRVDFLDMQGNTWHVLRRYNDFLDFHNRVHNCEIQERFPGKTWISCSGVQLAERRLDLERWTNAVFRLFAHIGIPKNLEPEFEDFLYRGASPVTAAYNPQAAPQALANFSVEVPAGVQPGQPLTVRSPYGASLQIIVPAGSKPGAILQVQPDGRVSLLRQAAGEPPQKVVLNISIPNGVPPGQKIAVKVPDGREITIEAPSSGGEVQMEFDAESGRLAPFQLDSKEKGTGDRFQVQVPAGVQCGQIINIQVPDGRQLPFAVPAGKTAGDELLLCLDTSGTSVLLA